jgi:hypothetical protein
MQPTRLPPHEVALQPGVAHSTQVPTSGIEESDIMSRHCSTLRHFGTPSGLEKTAALCEKRAKLMALWLF